MRRITMAAMALVAALGVPRASAPVQPVPRLVTGAHHQSGAGDLDAAPSDRRVNARAADRLREKP
jgi:hypothetical protein